MNEEQPSITKAVEVNTVGGAPAEQREQARTCKLNGVDPNQWLTHVLKNIAEHKVNRLHELFPQNFSQKIKM